MGENLTVRQKAKLAYLKRLCMTWGKFTEIKWSRVDIFVEDGDVNILWYQLLWLQQPNGKKEKHFNQSFKYFPISQLGAQVKEYKKKIGLEFRIRHLTEAQKDIERENDKSRRK